MQNHKNIKLMKSRATLYEKKTAANLPIIYPGLDKPFQTRTKIYLFLFIPNLQLTEYYVKSQEDTIMLQLSIVFSLSHFTY